MSPKHRSSPTGEKGSFRGLEEALSTIDACSSLERLTAAMHALANQLGYATFTYGEVPRLPLEGSELPFHLTKVRADFYSTYKNKNFIRHDPVWVQAMKRRRPFTWADCPEFELLGRRGPRSKARKVVETAYDFGYTQGVVVPAHSRDERGEPTSAMLSLYWQGPLKGFRPLCEFPRWFSMVACFFHDRVMEVRGFDGSSALPCTSLTARQRDCLIWVGHGKTFNETAEILGIGGRTVEFHIQNAMKKLGVYKAAHAAMTAVRCGLIAL